MVGDWVRNRDGRMEVRTIIVKLVKRKPNARFSCIIINIILHSFLLIPFFFFFLFLYVAQCTPPLRT